MIKNLGQQCAPTLLLWFSAGAYKVVQKSVLSIGVVAVMLLTPGPVIDWLKALMALPVMPPSETEFPTDKLVHCLLFAGSTFFCLQDGHKKPGVAVVLSGMLIFALLTEALQSMIPGRSADALDVLADASGVLLGWWWFLRVLRIKKARFAKTGL